MALASASHGDDQYGWDLSLEDEEELSMIADTSFAAAASSNNNVIATPRSPAARAAGSSGSGGSSSTARTVLRRPRARQPRAAATASAAAHSLRADVNAAFPRSPQTVTIAEQDDLSDIETLGRRSPDSDGETAPHGRPAGYRFSNQGPEPSEHDEPASPGSYLPEDVSYPDLTSALSAFESPSDSKSNAAAAELEAGADAGAAKGQKGANKSPLARFRTYPRKPFSVTDFSSAAWCEQQYEFTLFRLGGRKPATAAMKGGTRVHEKLEREVYTTVKVEILSREDALGLKVWNLVQGLRTLRETGLTRELEVWGLVDGHVVNGVIDGLKTEHPDPEFEEEIHSSQGSSSQASQGSSRVWVFDVKTRGHWSAPSMGHMRPAMIQLFLYHRFLSQMAAGSLDFLHVYRRYGLDPDEPFSDMFLAQIGSLHDEVFRDASSSPPSPGSDAESAWAGGQAPAKPSKLRYRNLRQLTGLLKEELRLAFPDGADTLGPIVSIEYRYRGKEPVVPSVEASEGEDAIDKGLRKKHRKKKDAEDQPDDLDVGKLIVRRDIHMDNERLDAWLEGNMEWWRGERAAVGVSIEDADKCRYCQFADDCGWRADMHEKAVAETKAKKKAAEAEQKKRRARRSLAAR